jgi:transglutaminase-like putative cysteine protease
LEAARLLEKNAYLYPGESAGGVGAHALLESGDMLIRFGYELAFFCPQPVTMICLLDAHHDHAHQIRVPGVFSSDPFVSSQLYTDSFGNAVRRFEAPAGPLRIWRDSLFEGDGLTQEIAPYAQEVPIPDVPSAYLVYLLGSRYCETDKLSEIAWGLFGNTPHGWARVQAICDFVNQHMTFGYEHARPTRSAYEAYQERVGVCRDFAHLAVTLCRCMNIPARYANGYLGDIGVPPDPAPMDFNAWLEVYLGGRWYTFDARHNTPRIGRIKVASGRDATDIPLISSFGPHVLQSFKVWTDEVAGDVPQGNQL